MVNIRLNSFIANLPDSVKVLIDCEWNYYRCTIADLKAYKKNRFYIVDSFGFENSDNWQLGVDCGANPLPDELEEDFLWLVIHDSRIN